MSSRVVLVTGGAKGVGRGISERFLAAGDVVIVCGREQPDSLPEQNGHRAEFIPCDVRKEDLVDILFKQVAQKHGRLDVLVNNAGGAPYVMADKASPRFHDAIIALRERVVQLERSERQDPLMARPRPACFR